MAQLIENVKAFFKQAFSFFKKPDDVAVENSDEANEIAEQEALKEELEKFTMKNVVLEKLNSLEQYIKIFSLPFPKEYSEYLDAINTEKIEYEAELENYRKGFNGGIVFAIDPECEANRLAKVAVLETKIKNFVDLTVTYNDYKSKFAELTNRLCIFYNTLISFSGDVEIIRRQISNATSSLNNILQEVKSSYFFSHDSRKKEEIFNYVIYDEYIMFKSLLRSSDVSNLEEYKNNFSKFHNLFIATEYDKLILKFFIEDIEEYQVFITNNLSNDSMYLSLLKNCESLQQKLNDYYNIFKDSDYFAQIVRFEDTVDTMAKAYDIDFNFTPSKLLDIKTNANSIISVKAIAMSALNLIKTDKAALVHNVISNFRYDISWRELFFLCKIFEVYKDVLTVADMAIFDNIKTNFLRYDEKYSEYSEEYISSKKKKILNYNGSKQKKYFLLTTVENANESNIRNLLESLYLDFVIVNSEVFLNYSYFKGFRNLEENFGNYVTF